MTLILNFICFLLLMTYSISQGDFLGMFLSSTGFLIMHALIEDLQDAD
jgi:hypothetical protein